MESLSNSSGGKGLIMSPSYLEPYEFELYDYKSWYVWMDSNWQVSIYLSLIYLSGIYLTSRWMSKRAPFDLRGPLVLWNIFLSFGSWFMFLRMYPEPLEEIRENGLYHSICNNEGHTIISSFWCLVFTLSKVLEFGDTAFILLRKQKLILLHYYHHVTVAMYTFYTFADFDPAGRFFGPMNSFVHTLMYGYYAMRAMGVKIPRKVNVGITSMQILQMVIGLGVNVASLVGKWRWDDCSRPYGHILWALAMYGSYFVLFVNFFVKSYANKRTAKGRKEE